MARKSCWLHPMHSNTHLLAVHPKVLDLVQRDGLVLPRPLLWWLVALHQHREVRGRDGSEPRVRAGLPAQWALSHTASQRTSGKVRKAPTSTLPPSYHLRHTPPNQSSILVSCYLSPHLWEGAEGAYLHLARRDGAVRVHHDGQKGLLQQQTRAVLAISKGSEPQRDNSLPCGQPQCQP